MRVVQAVKIWAEPPFGEKLTLSPPALWRDTAYSANCDRFRTSRSSSQKKPAAGNSRGGPGL